MTALGNASAAQFGPHVTATKRQSGPSSREYHSAVMTAHDKLRQAGEARRAGNWNAHDGLLREAHVKINEARWGDQPRAAHGGLPWNAPQATSWRRGDIKDSRRLP